MQIATWCSFVTSNIVIASCIFGDLSVKKVTLSLFAFSLLLFAVMRRSPARSIDPVPSGPGISVVTLNMAKSTEISRILHEFRAISALKDVDILLLQEVKQDENARQCAAELLAAELDMHVTYSPAATGVTDQGLAILS